MHALRVDRNDPPWFLLGTVLTVLVSSSLHAISLWQGEYLIFWIPNPGSSQDEEVRAGMEYALFGLIVVYIWVGGSGGSDWYVEI